MADQNSITYSVQSNWSWPRDYKNGWKTISSDRAGHQVFQDLEVAFRNLKHNADLARCICPMRVMDSHGRVYRIYDPEKDTRLPGCRHRMIQRNAYLLWEKAGSPQSDGTEFWAKAEAELQESDGIYDV